MAEITTAEINYMENGTWHFEVQLDDGYYILDVYPTLMRFKLVTPDNTYTGKAQDAEKTIPGLDENPELAQWLELAFDFEGKATNYQESIQHVNFTLDDNEYYVSFNNRTGEIVFHFPSKMILCPRNDLNTCFSELKNLAEGELNKIVLELINQPCLDMGTGTVSFNTSIPIPFSIENAIEHDIKNWKIWAGYIANQDLIFLFLSMRSIKTHLSTIKADFPELSVLHDGRFASKVSDILIRGGIQYYPS